MKAVSLERPLFTGLVARQSYQGTLFFLMTGRSAALGHCHRKWLTGPVVQKVDLSLKDLFSQGSVSEEDRNCRSRVKKVLIATTCDPAQDARNRTRIVLN